MAAGPSWLVDSRRIATKIKSASETCDPKRINWKSNPTRPCPNCNHIIDNTDVAQEWPGLPRGVKFDPSDQELLWHLLAKVGVGNAKPHPFIDEFIPTVDKNDGICYTHPRMLPECLWTLRRLSSNAFKCIHRLCCRGCMYVNENVQGVKEDGNVSHFFHRTIRAYNTGTRKRRKIQDCNFGDVRWHKTGKTKSVVVDGIQKGCKKIMVLYLSKPGGGKPEKTNWVMHQYHLGTGEDENDGEFVVSKVFYQQQSKPGDKSEQEQPLDMMEMTPFDMVEPEVSKVDPVTPKSVTPDPPRSEKWHPDLVPRLGPISSCNDHHAQSTVQVIGGNETEHLSNVAESEWKGKLNDQENQSTEPKWWEGESQFLLDSQQLVEGLSICDEFLQSQSSSGGGEPRKVRPRLSDYAQIGAEDLKKDLEECQKMTHFDHLNLELDTPPELRLSQMEFGSQDSFLAWGSKVAD